MSPRKRRLAEKFRSLYLWHRYAGLVAALLAAWLAVTGIVLNHTEDLDLPRTHVGQRWLLALYNIEPPTALRGQRIGDHWLTVSGDRVYLDGAFIGHAAFAAATPTAFGFAVAFPDRVKLFTADAVLIEELPFPASSASIDAIAAQDGRLLIRAGGRVYASDADVTAFEPVDAAIALPQPEREPLPEALAAIIAGDVLAHSLDWERVMLDLHSGRLFGRAGVWMADIAGVLLLLLAATGVIVWLQRARARRVHRKNW